MSVAAAVDIARRGPSAPAVSEEQARAEANEIVKHLAKLDGYPFDARYSEGARDQAVRLAELMKDAYGYFAGVFPDARPQILATLLKPRTGSGTTGYRRTIRPTDAYAWRPMTTPCGSRSAGSCTSRRRSVHTPG
jgi:hypothetical protein